MAKAQLRCCVESLKCGLWLNPNAIRITYEELFLKERLFLFYTHFDATMTILVALLGAPKDSRVPHFSKSQKMKSSTITILFFIQ